MRTLALVLCSFLLVASIAPAAAQKKQEALVLTEELHRAPTIGSAATKVWEWLRGEWGAPDPNRALDSDQNTFIHYASANRLDILREAVQLGGDCNRKNRFGATPLHFAATQEALGPGADSLRILVRCEAREGVQRECARGDKTGKSCRADPNARDRRGNTPLHVLYDYVEQQGAFPIRELPRQPGTAGARTDVLKALLQEAKADPNIKNAKGDTPLMLLIRRGHPVFTKTGHASFLLKNGADPNTRNKEGETPLFEALSLPGNSRSYDYDMKNLIILLIKHGAGPDQRDARGDTPLIRAAKHKGDIVQEMEALLGGGADQCLRDKSGKVAYDHTAKDSSGRILLYKADGYVDRDTGLCAADLLKARAREKKLNLSRKMKREIQACLVELKLDQGKPGDEFGPRTREAIRTWQKRKGKKGSRAAGYLASGEPDALLASAACRPARPEPVSQEATPKSMARDKLGLTPLHTAARAGNRRAMLALGRAFVKGLGVSQNFVEAHKWLNLAAARGDAKAAAERDALAKQMTVEEQAEARKLARAWRAAGRRRSTAIVPRRKISRRPSREPARPAIGFAVARAKAALRAAAAGDLSALEKALAAGADPNARGGRRGWTPLMYAANKGYTLLVPPLLKAGAKPNLRAADGATALFIAVLRRHSEIIAMLMKAGADPKIKGPKGKRIVDVAWRVYRGWNAARQNNEDPAVLTLLRSSKLWFPEVVGRIEAELRGCRKFQSAHYYNHKKWWGGTAYFYIEYVEVKHWRDRLSLIYKTYRKIPGRFDGIDSWYRVEIDWRNISQVKISSAEAGRLGKMPAVEMRSKIENAFAHVGKYMATIAKDRSVAEPFLRKKVKLYSNEVSFRVCSEKVAKKIVDYISLIIRSSQ